MSDLLRKEAGYEGSSLANAGGLIPKAHIEKVYQWYKNGKACIGPGVCMLLLGPFFALLAVFLVLLGVTLRLACGFHSIREVFLLLAWEMPKKVLREP